MASIGHYEVVRRLGAGHHSEVLLCRNSNTEVVIKLLQIRSRHLRRRIAKGDTKIAERLRRSFQDETSLTASFDHSNIVAVLESGELPDGTPYFAMPYMPQSLAEHVWPLHRPAFLKTPYLERRIKPVGAEDTITTLLALLEALATVHYAGAAHRDVKPNNVLIDARGTPVLCDFGAALLPSGESVTWRSRFGAPPFISPEQLANAASADARADIYAVGAIGHLMLLGCPPNIGTASPDHPMDARARNLQAWLEPLLDPNPDGRPQDAVAALETLRMALA